MPFACEVCGAIVSRRYDLLNRHALLHSTNAPTYFCPYPDCARNTSGFAQKSNLKTHINARHTKYCEKRWHRCRYDNCEMAFADRSALNRHEKNAGVHRDLCLERKNQRHATQAAKKLKERKTSKAVDKNLIGSSVQASSSSTSEIPSKMESSVGLEKEIIPYVPASPTHPGQSQPDALPTYDLTSLSSLSPASESSLIPSAHFDPETFISEGTPFSNDSDLSSCASMLSFPSTPLSPFMPDLFPAYPEPSYTSDFPTDAAFGFGYGYPAIDINAWLSSTQDFSGLPGNDLGIGLESSSDMAPWRRPSQKDDEQLLETEGLDSTSAIFDFGAWDSTI